MEREFKVGDRVRVKDGAFSSYFKPGNTGTVIKTYEDFSVRVQFDKPYFKGEGIWLAAVCSLERLPDPSPFARKVISDAAWAYWTSPLKATAKAYAAKPEPTRRWCVAADLPTTITTWHDTYEGAVNEAKRLFKKTGQTFRVLEVVMEIEPGDPVIREYTDNPF